MKTKKKTGKLTGKEKKLQDATLRAIDMILNNMVSKKMTDINLIKSFEFIEKSLKYRKLDLNDIALFMYNSKIKDFDKLNDYFKYVQKIIRKNAEKSILLKELLEVVKTTIHSKMGIVLTKKGTKNAYNKVLDWYDPNKNQSIRNKMFRWEGFWSLISTENGIIVGVFLSDTMDRDLFYEAINFPPGFVKTKQRRQKRKDT